MIDAGASGRVGRFPNGHASALLVSLTIVGDVAAHLERYCRACRYFLRGVRSRRCPECGRAFDPDDPDTTLPVPIAETWVALAGFGRTAIRIAGVTAAVGIASSFTGRDPFWLALGAFCLLHVLLGALAISILPPVPLRARERVMAFMFVAAIVTTVLTQWPLRVSFMLHRPFMERIADRVKAGEALEGPQWIGIFRFRRALLHGTGNVGFQLSGNDGGGFYMVREEPGSTMLWYNADRWARLSECWHFIYED
jgi:hypothetical protein